MASVFTYDPDPPRVSSPWLRPEDLGNDSGRGSTTPGVTQVQTGLLSEYGVTRLQAEPQQGPTEYKLHLLLRPRRTFKTMSTASAAVKTSKPLPTPSQEAYAAKHPTTSPTATSEPRQQRLQHLTTQLLWRLQQSSPYHSSSSKELTIPKLLDDGVDLAAPVKIETLVPGLEESRGALYEIGVSDDGTLIGLTKDEMDESISTLRIMAASLGCSIEILRMVIVGGAEWIESAELVDNPVVAPVQVTRTGNLWVAEALVMPSLGFVNGAKGDASTTLEAGQAVDAKEAVAIPSRGKSVTPQLRVTFTGPTTSGKSSLLGTLSTGTLDNGRGKSRLSLLKHRHEVVSGVTSSIAQELIGYKDGAILNYSHGNIESWVDIHDCSENGRLVFVSDSAGHPRYRRTVLRGLMNWAPHWIILCVAADDMETASGHFGATSSAQDVLGVAAAGVDLVKAHLTLSLQLDVPMAIVITKLDLASKASLQRTMVKILTALKEAGRQPKILQPDQRRHDELKEIPQEDQDKVREVLKGISESGQLTSLVPIVLTSAVQGKGMGLMHALLENLPLPPAPTSRDFVGLALNPEQPKCLFHIDDTFSLPASYCALAGNTGRLDRGIVVSGHLRFGRLSVGDKIVIGPFPSEDDDPRGSTPEDRPSPGSYGLSISHPASAELARIAMKNAVSASAIAGEWHDAQIVSIRNLRLPVLSLEAGQAGSMGLVLDSPALEQASNGAPSTPSAAEVPRIRRGMILAVPSKHMSDTGLKLQAASGFTAVFKDPDTQSLAFGSFVNVYNASIRTIARVLRVVQQADDEELHVSVADADDDIFNLIEETESKPTEEHARSTAGIEVSLELLHHREWIELGSRVILLEGGSQDKSGLEGFVGSVVEIVD
ncbi:hypothetical protein G7046_g4561 [Stylonectria norvegica]|nr:hypothetical protein G7046_g4561 [Stylonectria norvegica]